MSPHPLARIAPSVEFPVTVCVLCYGPHTDHAQRFLSSLYRHTDPALFQLRAGLNETAPDTLRLFSEYQAEYGNVELFVEPRNVFKSPLMRRMLTAEPPPGRWLIWFDDDSYVTRPDWLTRLSLKMAASPEVVQWGKIYRLLRNDPALESFVRNAPWFRGLPLRRGRDGQGPEADEFIFVTGGFWAIRTDILRRLDWPDPRLKQADDDFLLGEALRQNGWLHGAFEHGVAINTGERRNPDAPEVRHLMP